MLNARMSTGRIVGEAAICLILAVLVALVLIYALTPSPMTLQRVIEAVIRGGRIAYLENGDYDVES